MLLWIAAVGSTWAAYALGLERLMGVAERAEMRTGGSRKRAVEDRRRAQNGR
jgi:hypothetical protein